MGASLARPRRRTDARLCRDKTLLVQVLPVSRLGFAIPARRRALADRVSPLPVSFLAGRGRLQVVAANKMTLPSLSDPDIQQFKTGPNDTGSSSLQIALLTKRIESLTAHLMTNKKDYATQRGLRMLLGQRSRLTKYLKKDDPARYESTMEGLGLKVK